MAVDDWYRNEKWDESIAEAFRAKLKRARNKSEYLRVQAGTLAKTYPEVSICLIEQYFELGEDTMDAAAHTVRAEAYLALGRVDDAIQAFEDALSREAVFPNVKTTAWLVMPYLIATQGLSDHYERALGLLESRVERLSFPIEIFKVSAAHSLIAMDLGDTESAREHAKRALHAAAQDHSGFRYHKDVGLVGKQYDTVIKQLQLSLSAHD